MPCKPCKVVNVNLRCNGNKDKADGGKYLKLTYNISVNVFGIPHVIDTLGTSPGGIVLKQYLGFNTVNTFVNTLLGIVSKFVKLTPFFNFS